MVCERPVPAPPGPRSARRRRLRRVDSALESAREAKYAEIRDNEIDYRTGKLSEEDFRALDATLRAEAIEILRGIEQYDMPSPPRGRPSR